MIRDNNAKKAKGKTFRLPAQRPINVENCQECLQNV